MDNPDSDGDGIWDGAEVQQGTDPLDGLPTATGVIAGGDTPGTAVDVCAVNNVAIVADSANGVTVFDVTNGQAPVAIAQVDTPSTAVAVSCAGNLIPVANGIAGLAIIDVTDPPAAFVARQISQFELGGPAQAVTTAGKIVYVGTTNGLIVSVDLTTSTILERLTIGQAIHDLRLDGDFLYALSANTLYTLALSDVPLQVRSSASAPGLVNTNHGRKRLFVGGGVAYAVHRKGFNTIDVSDPSNPVLVSAGNTQQFGWKQFVANGSGLGVATNGPNGSFDGPHDVSLYDLDDPFDTSIGNEGRFLTTFPTAGVARAVSIFNGLAYVADHDKGLKVINYRAYDAFGIAPTIDLSANFSLMPGEAEEGKRVRLTAQVTDDVQVRNVAFFVDGVNVVTDGNFPFEHRFVTPVLAQQQAFTVRAVATDTGGNTADTGDIVVTILRDFTPPRIVSVVPTPGAATGRVNLVAALFDEPIDVASVTSGGLVLFEAGPDGVRGNEDDEPVLGGNIEFREEVLGVFMSFDPDLPPGRYRATVTALVLDLAGNAVDPERVWDFTVYDVGEDRDGDCVPDDLESILGLDPDDPDTNGNGTSDGDEDFDGDGLSNCGEVILNQDATNVDSDGDGVLDGDEDADFDDLCDGEEMRRRTNPLERDTDRDGWPDGAEISCGPSCDSCDVISDPLDPLSRPKLFVVSGPPVSSVLPGPGDARGLLANTTVASPAISTMLPGFGDTRGLLPNTTTASPEVSVMLPGFGNQNGLLANTTVALPPISLLLPGSGDFGGLLPNTTVALPSVSVQIDPGP